MEDIDLGYRLARAGYGILLDPEMSCSHIKGWTLRTALMSDFFDRAIPWTRLIWKYRQFDGHLNVRADFRWSTLLAVAGVMVLAVGTVAHRLLAALPAMILSMTIVNARFYRFFLDRRGLWFTLRVWALRPFQDCLNALAFASATIVYGIRALLDRHQEDSAIALTRQPESHTNAAGIGVVSAPTPAARPAFGAD